MKKFDQVKEAVSRGYLRAGALVGTVMASVPAFAQTEPEYEVFDGGASATVILGLVAGVLAIGGAVFAIHLAAKSTKWGRKAL